MRPFCRDKLIFARDKSSESGKSVGVGNPNIRLKKCANAGKTEKAPSSGAKAARLAEEYTHSEVHSGGDGQQGLKFV